MHNLANVHPNAKIGENVTIEPFATVQEDVEIGDGSWIGPNAVVMNGARLGKNVKIHSGAVISGNPQDLKYKGEETFTYIGDNSEIRECATVNKGTTDRNETRIGKNCLIMAYVHIAHDILIGDNVIVAVGTALAGHMTIEDYAIIEGISGAQQFLRIGAHCFIAAGSLIRKNVPPYTKCAREPLTYTGINAIGLRRRGWDEEVIKEIESIYKTIFIHNQNVAKGLAQVKEKFPSSQHRNQIIEFIESSKNGVIKGAN